MLTADMHRADEPRSREAPSFLSVMRSGEREVWGGAAGLLK